MISHQSLFFTVILSALASTLPAQAKQVLPENTSKRLGSGDGPSLSPCPEFQLRFTSTQQSSGSAFMVDLDVLNKNLIVDRSGQTWPDKTTVTLKIKPEVVTGDFDESCSIEIKYSHKFKDTN